MAGYGDHEAIDVEDLIRDLQRKVSVEMAMPSRCSIFKIPTILSRHNQNAFSPNAFSFGPFHHDKHALKPTEKIKSKYLLGLISRLSHIDPSNHISPDTTLRNLTEALRDVQEQALEYYAEPIGMSEYKFLEILVLDGCFIIELLRKKSYLNLREENDPIFSMSCMLQFLHHDLILLENQIPWFVLEILFDLTKTTSLDTKPLVELVIDFFGTIFSTTPMSIQPLLSLNPNHASKHILDLLRNLLVLNSNKRKQKSLAWKPMLSAEQLKDSGIQFRKDLASESLLDIKFCKKKGIFSIPTLLVQETTETVFRNLISLEQCCPNYEPIVTSYAVLLDNLINTKTDLQILSKSGAIISWLNAEDGTRFFNRLYLDTYVKENYYLQLTNEVDNFIYCQRRLFNRYRRVLVRDYFKNPWLNISVNAAFIVLVLILLHTVFTIINIKG